MAYTIKRSDGTTLTTVQDGTIDTTSTSLGLPGRSFSGYGNVIDTNFVKQLENFASTNPPSNSLRGQLWFNTATQTLNICPVDGAADQAQWITLAATSSISGATAFGNIVVSGNISANNINVANRLDGNVIFADRITAYDRLQVDGTAVIATGNIATLNTSQLTTGDTTTTGSITGDWAIYGNPDGAAMRVSTGNINFTIGSVYGIKCDRYMYANGEVFNPVGTYTNTSVSNYLTGAGGVSQFRGNIAPNKVTTNELAGGGKISGSWTLEAGAKLQATYADLAERFEADSEYEPGTVVELGGDKEITAVVDELSDTVFGVVSNTAAYLMNSAAGEDATHPPVAISGRVQVKVHGQVKKGDRLVSAGKGYARAATKLEITAFNTIGRSLTTKTTSGPGTVEAIVIIR
jgi:hypothetical protein